MQELPEIEVQVVQGPVVPASSGVLYNVTLANGHIVTSPEGWSEPPTPTRLPYFEAPPTERSRTVV